MFRRQKIARKLAKIGSHVDESYMVYVNNDEPVSFPSKSACISYLDNYRENNSIFLLKLFRIEIYSL